DLDPFALVEVFPALHFALGGRYHSGLRARILERLARLGELGLLEAFRRQNGHFHAAQRCHSHASSYTLRQTKEAMGASRRRALSCGCARVQAQRKRAPAVESTSGYLVASSGRALDQASHLFPP